MDISSLSVSNSDTERKQEEQKPEERRFEKVIDGSVTVAKKAGRVFLSEDANHVGSYLFEDVVAPSVKKILYDLLVKAAKILFYGRNSADKDPYSNKMPVSKVSYANPSIGPGGKPRETAEKISGYYFENLMFSTREQAETVLFAMDEAIQLYGRVSVRDFYDFAGKTGNYTDMNYGWRSLESAKIYDVDGGYVIRLPKVRPLD